MPSAHTAEEMMVPSRCLLVERIRATLAPPDRPRPDRRPVLIDSSLFFFRGDPSRIYEIVLARYAKQQVARTSAPKFH